MAEYMQRLEKAVAQAQKKVSSEPHPLLVAGSQIRPGSPVPGLQDDDESEGESETGRYQQPDADTDELAAALGSISIQNDDQKQFHGETATSEYLIEESDEMEDGYDFIDTLPAKCPLPPLNLPPELVLFNVQFPCPPTNQEPPEMDWFLPCLPPYSRALTLITNYLSFFSWCAMPLPKLDLERTFNTFYSQGTKATTINRSDAHSLAVLFMVFVMGTLYDLNLGHACFSAQTEEFHSLARAAMSADPVTEHTTTQGVRAIMLMIWYFRLYPGRRSPSYQWALSGFLTKLVQAIGLHRDSSKSLSDPIQQGCYEQTFWEYNSVDIWQSFMFGRPTSMASSVIQCKLPLTVEVPQGHDPSFYCWKYSFTRLVSDVVTQITGSKETEDASPGKTSAASVLYADILKHEKILKAHYTPPSLAWPTANAPLPTDAIVGKTFQRYVSTVWKHVSIMYLHRQYFREAISKHGGDPSKSPYWQSVVAAYDSAVALVHDMRRLWLAHPRLIERMCPFWSHTLSAALVLGGLVVFSPGCQFAESALRHLEETYEMYSEAKDSLQPSNALSAMRKLQHKARNAFCKFHNLPDQSRSSLSRSGTESPFTFGDSPLHPRSERGGFSTPSSIYSEDTHLAIPGPSGLPSDSVRETLHVPSYGLGHGDMMGASNVDHQASRWDRSMVLNGHAI